MLGSEDRGKRKIVNTCNPHNNRSLKDQDTKVWKGHIAGKWLNWVLSPNPLDAGSDAREGEESRIKVREWGDEED